MWHGKPLIFDSGSALIGNLRCRSSLTIDAGASMSSKSLATPRGGAADGEDNAAALQEKREVTMPPETHILTC